MKVSKSWLSGRAFALRNERVDAIFWFPGLFTAVEFELKGRGNTSPTESSPSNISLYTVHPVDR